MTQLTQTSKIEWTHYTANPWWGCTHVHPGCDNCYAETWANRYRKSEGLWTGNRRAVKSFFPNLHKWNKQAEADGVRRLVFVGSMCDIFEKAQKLIAPFTYAGSRKDEWITTGEIRRNFLHWLAVGMWNNLIFLFLTKRPSNIMKVLDEQDVWHHFNPQNVMFGASASDQTTWDTMSRHLDALPLGYKRFMSVEPQIAPIKPYFIHRLHWVIQGGESGTKARPFDLEWANHLRAHCQAWEVPYFFKQIDKKTPIPKPYLLRQFPDFINLEIPKK